jgi:hypothetical protein
MKKNGMQQSEVDSKIKTEIKKERNKIVATMRKEQN